jgi:hypothetical protein
LEIIKKDREDIYTCSSLLIIIIWEVNMAGLESSMDLAESARKIKKPDVSSAERERQKAFLEQLRARKPVKVKEAKKSKAKARSKKGKKMTRAKEDETYFCTVCGCEVVCTSGSESPIICCDEVMCIIE